MKVYLSPSNQGGNSAQLERIAKALVSEVA